MAELEFAGVKSSNAGREQSDREQEFIPFPSTRLREFSLLALATYFLLKQGTLE